jgi:hypothetical protein
MGKRQVGKAYAERNRRYSRARQRAYFELARRHPEEFARVLNAEKRREGIRVLVEREVAVS